MCTFHRFKCRFPVSIKNIQEKREKNLWIFFAVWSGKKLSSSALFAMICLELFSHIVYNFSDTIQLHKDTNLKKIEFPMIFFESFLLLFSIYILSIKNFMLNFVERTFIEFSWFEVQGQFAFVLKISLSILDKINIENTTQMS